MVVVLDLGVGQGRALHRAPHHRLGAAVELVRTSGTCGTRRRWPPRSNSPWSSSGRSQSPSTPRRLKPSICTPIQLVGVFAAAGAELGLGDLVLAPALGAQLFLDLPLDRQAVAVPAGHVVDVVAEQEARADDEVLQGLLQRVADVDGAVGVGRAVVQHDRAARPPPAGPCAWRCRGRCSAHCARISGSFCGRPARMGNGVSGRKTVSR